MPHSKYWLGLLPVLFLLATFEHCYAILHLYRGGLLFPVVTTVLLVLAIDLSIYLAMLYIELVPARLILVMSGTISIALNIKYMLDWRPDGWFGLIIAVLVGVLIPLMLCLFGWLNKAIRQQQKEIEQNGQLSEQIKAHLDRHPELSNRRIASMIGCSHTTVSRYRKEKE